VIILALKRVLRCVGLGGLIGMGGALIFGGKLTIVGIFILLLSAFSLIASYNMFDENEPKKPEKEGK